MEDTTQEHTNSVIQENWGSKRDLRYIVKKLSFPCSQVWEEQMWLTCLLGWAFVSGSGLGAFAIPGTGRTEPFGVRVTGGALPKFGKKQTKQNRFSHKQEWASFVFTLRWFLSLTWRQGAPSAWQRVCQLPLSVHQFLLQPLQSSVAVTHNFHVFLEGCPLHPYVTISYHKRIKLDNWKPQDICRLNSISKYHTD